MSRGNLDLRIEVTGDWCLFLAKDTHTCTVDGGREGGREKKERWEWRRETGSCREVLRTSFSSD